MPTKQGKKNVSYNLTIESIQKLEEIAKLDQRSRGLELEYLISKRWQELKGAKQ